MSLPDRVQGMVLRGRIVATRVANGVQRSDLQVLADDSPADVEQVGQYGLAASPLEGAGVIVVAVQGKAEDLVIIALDDRRHRPADLGAGDVCLYDHRGRRITLKSDRAEIRAPRIDLGQGATKAVARVGDDVTLDEAFLTWLDGLATAASYATPRPSAGALVASGSSVVKAVD